MKVEVFYPFDENEIVVVAEDRPLIFNQLTTIYTVLKFRITSHGDLHPYRETWRQYANREEADAYAKDLTFQVEDDE